ncbi:Thiol-disulfide oxidoreductase ResA [Paraconexibacter sp. AEG42_29]|uniref:Thiol-disulfide oxidoreductase ResA n=1 Tax=Paraconexibacter sp. AEG42_29 TaxID=2997339 RepID=A0AAU7AZ66_9ACTN
MKRSAVPSVALIAAAALVALLVYGVAIKGSDTTLDDAVRKGRLPQAPGATMKLPRLDGGGKASISDFRGKVVVVNVWASWCGPCADEAPVLQKAQKALEADGAGTVLGVTNNDFPNKSIAFERKHGLTFPSVRDLGIKLYRKLGGTGVPETFVLDAKGRIVALSRGQVSEEFLTQAIAKAKAST